MVTRARSTEQDWMVCLKARVNICRFMVVLFMQVIATLLSKVRKEQSVRSLKSGVEVVTLLFLTQNRAESVTITSISALLMVRATKSLR